MTEMQIGTAFSVASATFNECEEVRTFIDASVRPIVDRELAAMTSVERETNAAALLRVISWLRSLSKLQHPADFQAVVTCARSMFEIVVDLTLLALDAPNNPHEKLLAWEESSKVQAAQRIQSFFAGRSVPR